MYLMPVNLPDWITNVHCGEWVQGDSGADGMTKWEERYGKFSDLASIYNGRKGIDWQDETWS